MNTQVIFKIDKKLKTLAQAKAKREGISLADIYKSVTNSYVNGKMGFELVYYGTLTPNKKTGKELLKAKKEIREGKGLSPAFKTVAEMDAYLDSLK